MAWNRKDTILEAGSTAEIDADVIFTSAFVGLAIGYAKKKKNWRVAMEPDLDLTTGDQGKRTDKDKASMTKHNNLCTLVNQAVRKSLGNNEFTLSWGFSPEFTAGGMIAGGDMASLMDETLNPKFKEIARKYLTAAQNPSSRTDPWEMYIGRGAYCGLVLDENGDAVSAMSTVRTTIKETTLPGNGNLYPHPLDNQVGDRWCPPTTNPGYTGKDSTAQSTAPVNRTWVWGMINNADTQQASANEGMNFYFGNNNQKGTDIVGYTHGLPRCVYECVRAKKGYPYEMSIGVKTFKLASCMGCTFFMIANGFDPSASHVGKAESWSPLYHVQGNNPAEVLAPIDDAHDQIQAFELANNRFADCVTGWMKDGVEAITKVAGDEWLNSTHSKSLDALRSRLSKLETGNTSPAHRLVCCNLLLDAFTWHKGDAERVNATLKIGKSPMQDCGGGHWWWDTDKKTTLENYKNPYSDEYIKKLTDLNTLKLSQHA